MVWCFETDEEDNRTGKWRVGEGIGRKEHSSIRILLLPEGFFLFFMRF